LKYPGHANRQTDKARQKSNRGERSFARRCKSADEKPDLHFRRNGTIKIPFQLEERQASKFTTAAIKSNKHVRRSDSRARGHWNVPAVPIASQSRPDNRATAASSHLLVIANRRMRNRTYISVGIVPSISPSRVRFVNLVSAPLPQPNPRSM
jgi:hypothetical protein